MPIQSHDPSACLVQACQRWPKVIWPLNTYARHLAQAGEDCQHPVDLYLSGAAGHRLDPAWVTLETDPLLGPRVQQTINSPRFPKADFSAPDLWAQTRLHLLQNAEDQPPLPDGRRPAAIIKYRAQVPLLHYLLRIAQRLAISRHLQLKRRKTRSLEVLTDPQGHPISLPDPRAPEPAQTAQERQVVTRMAILIPRAYADLEPQQQFLLRMVLGQGMKQKDAGRLLGWAEYKAAREMKKAEDLLKEHLGEFETMEWTDSLRRAWCRIWVEVLQAAQDRLEPSSA